MNHELSHNSIECYNCGKSGHIKPNCPEPIRARHVGAVHVEDSPAGEVDNADLDINDNINDEHPDEDEYHNNEYDKQLDLSKDQWSWGSKPSEFNWSDDEQTHRINSVRYSHNLARIAAVVPIGPTNARKAKIAKEGEPLHDHMVKMKTTRPAWSKHDLLTITGYFLVGGTKARCLFDSGYITIGQQMYTETFNITNVDYYDVMLGTPFLRRVKANIDFNDLGSIVINGETIDNDLSVWLASEEAKVHGMSTNKVTLQEEKPLGPIAEQLAIRTKEKSFKTVRNELLVVPVP
ncbi:hypothetical protein M422DRAFT_256069 [Sphaerobolus stellatus SS14]|uniref:CCHC-type domain-containing protein n=1 Tax=Sphaerobolus stellatus (strain SS14) TaxID=990650 RepID=A0A0C9UCQ8_SPHS4|nr:hypothetical protein M422DRAFT_256069 [Sphaerobolus stellatus SS14]